MVVRLLDNYQLNVLIFKNSPFYSSLFLPSTIDGFTPPIQTKVSLPVKQRFLGTPLGFSYGPRRWSGFPPPVWVRPRVGTPVMKGQRDAEGTFLVPFQRVPSHLCVPLHRDHQSRSTCPLPNHGTVSPRVLEPYWPPDTLTDT